MKRFIYTTLLAFLLTTSVVQAAVTFPVNGGTGTSIIPTVGQVLLATTSGSTVIYIPVATSSLGITGGGGGSGTVTSVAATVPTGLTIGGSPITTSGTLAFTYTGGYSIPLTASTTQGVNAYASTTALNGVTPILYNIGTGAISCPTCVINSYASSTFPSFAYGSSTYYFASNPAGYITSAGAPVQSVFTRTGAITAQTGDYAAFYPTFAYGTSTYGGLFLNNTWSGGNIFGNSTTTNAVMSNSSTTNATTTNFILNGASAGCAQFASGGKLSSTGTACGSGGSGNSAFTIGNGFIYNATSTDSVGIGTTTPTAKLDVVGTAGNTIPFRVASSSLRTLLQVNPNGTIYLGNSTAATEGTFIYDNTSASNNNFFGIYSSGNARAYGISESLPSPVLSGGINTSSVGGYYAGLGIGGGTSFASQPIFGVLNSAQSGNGIGSTAFTVIDNNKIYSFNNTLDDGTGAVGISTSTPGAKLDVYGTSGTNDIFRLSSSTNAREVTVTAAGKMGIGSSTPTTDFVVSSTTSNGTYMSYQSNAPLTADIFQIATSGMSVSSSTWGVDSVGHQYYSGGKPTTNCSGIGGVDQLFTVTENATSSCNVNFGTPFAVAPMCEISNNSGTIRSFVSSSSTTSILISNSTGLTGTVTALCSYPK